METNIQIFTYEETDIEFEISSKKVMVNATEMAKPFGKLPAHFLANQQITEFIEECCKDKNYYKIFGVGYRNSDIQSLENGNSQEDNSPLENRKTDFVKVVKGGAHQGTWMHRLVALKFAQWLNPAFDLWCTMIIEDILQNPIKKIKEATTVIEKLAADIKEKEDKYRKEFVDFDYYINDKKELTRLKKMRGKEIIQTSFDF